MDEQFDKAFKLRHLYRAVQKCSRGTMWKDGTAVYRSDGLENSVKLRRDLLQGTYKLQHYQHFQVTRPKPREITATRIRDRHAQRAACDVVLYGEITRPFIYDNGACQINRGVDHALNRTKCGLQRMYRQQRRSIAEAAGCRVEDVGPFQPHGWVYKGDVRKYFPSTLHRNAKAIIRKTLRSPKLAAMFCAVIESFGETWWKSRAIEAGADDKAAGIFSRAITNARTEKEMLPMRPEAQRAALAAKCDGQIREATRRLPGLTAERRAQLLVEVQSDEARGIALGSQLSQLVQLAQLDGLDHYVVEVIRPSFYVRYMDDFLLFDTDKDKLEAAAAEIEQRLDGLGLSLNPKSQLVPLRAGFVFLKWHMYLSDTGRVEMWATPAVVKDEKRRLRRMAQRVRDGKATAESIRAHYEGWRAHVKRGKTRQLLRSMDKYVNGLLADIEEVNTE